jgi:hypothetical protein
VEFKSTQTTRHYVKVVGKKNTQNKKRRILAFVARMKITLFAGGVFDEG